LLDMSRGIRLKGVGTFESGETKIEARFEILRQPMQTLFIIEQIKVKDVFDPGIKHRGQWKLVGFLEDKREIRCEELFLTRLDIGEKARAEFAPLGALAIIGNEVDAPVIEARYPLVGFFKGNAELRDDDWSIAIVDGETDSQQAEQMSKAWRIPIEGLVLRLEHTDARMEQYEDKARQVMQLLSLACGNGVSCQRQIISWGNTGKLEIWHHMTGDELGPGPCVPSFCIQQFLEQVFPAWRNWPEKKKAEARLAISYINLSASGYLDSRLFQIMQAWEMLSNAWGHTVNLSEHEKMLKSDIKHVYKEWKKKHPKADPNGFLGDRINFSFRWPQARKRMEALAHGRGLDTSKIGLNFEQMKEVRDSVAHSGKMPEKMSDSGNGSLKLLTAAQYGLQLLLLVELGYSGIVVAAERSWRSFIKIGEILKNY
jgi:hypothetical protein